jgi:hypothetical protein
MGQKAAAVTAPSSNFTSTANAIDADNDINPSLIGNAQGLLGGAQGLLGGAGANAGKTALLTSAFGLAGTAASALMSMSEAGKAADAQRSAEREAERLAEDARRRKEQNLYEAVQVPLQAYERQFREGTAAGSEAINALAQDQRMLIGGAQGVQEATIEGQAKTREALADRIYTDAMTKAGAGMAINQDLAKLDLEEAAGAQIAAMAAEKAKIAQQQAALQGAGGLITQGVGLIGTYGGFANQGDQLQTLLGGTSFAKPAATAQTDYAKILQGLMQDPNIAQYISAKMK